MSDILDLMASTKPLITLVMDDELLQRIDDFRFGFRLPSRAAAIRMLIESGLEAEITGSIPVPRPKPQERKPRS